MDIVVNVLFAILATVGGALLSANIALVTLKLFHRRSQAVRFAKVLAPAAAYLKLGGVTPADRERVKHVA